jgi:D-alanyl-D-alanine carboxypeptidase
MYKKLSVIILLFFTLLLYPNNSHTTTVSSEYSPFLLLVNKEKPLNKDFIPTDLIPIENVPYIIRKGETMLINIDVYYNYLLLYNEAFENDLELTIFSGYRSFEKQEKIWSNNPNENYVAKPGYSEHQTGLAIDVSRKDIGLTKNFKNTKEYQYLKNNAYKYGFIIRYPEDKEYITGYLFEPWHLRYVGEDIAKEIYEHNLTLEEYLS